MEQSPGFVAQGGSGLVCKLHQSLYGLKQSPRTWLGKLFFLHSKQLIVLIMVQY